MSRKITLLILLLLGLFLAACGGSSDESMGTGDSADTSAEEADDDAMDEESSADEAFEEGSGGSGPDSSSGGERDAAAPPEEPLYDKDNAEVTELVVEAESADGSGDAFRADGAALDPNSELTAGVVDDNADWDDYLIYLNEYAGAAPRRVDVSQRHQLFVVDEQGNSILGATVDLMVGDTTVQTLRTHSDGRASFFPAALANAAQADQYTAVVRTATAETSILIDAAGPQREWTATVSAGADGQVNLDVMFLIDATGSMSDEIEQLTDNIRSIAATIDALPADPDVRFGMVTYRDEGDDYVTEATDFTPDIQTFEAVLDLVVADGGGDYPEDVNSGLFDALNSAEWRVEDTVSLIFLIADAPPHLDYGQQYEYDDAIFQANERGIKIYPIASSGLDTLGEYVFRQLAQTTGARFIFLTYGAAGPGSSGTETEFEDDDYEVGSLDQMVIEIVEDELAPLVR